MPAIQMAGTHWSASAFRSNLLCHQAQVLQRLGLVDGMMKYKEPGDGFHISRHTFKPLLTAIDTPVRTPLSKAEPAVNLHEVHC